jgi:hypothetical protein
MGSGVLLAALVVLWFVVLVPMVVTRGDAQGGRVEAADAGRTLQRRRGTTVAAATERVDIDSGALIDSGELQVDVHALRRRTLGGLAALAGAALLAALLYRPWMWAPQVFLDVVVVGYLLVLRRTARRERLAARRMARAAAREAMRPAASRIPAPRLEDLVLRTITAEPVDAPVVEEQHTVAAQLPHPSVPLAPVHTLRPGRVVAARTPAPAGWQNSAVVGLDDDDLGFADIDEYQPRVVNG